MKTLVTTAAALLALAAPAFAEGDAAKGEKAFKKCKACHMIVSDSGEEIYKGGKTGPNLYGVIGRVAGSYDGFKYGKGLSAAQEEGFVWTEAELAEYVQDPKAYNEKHGWPKQSKMSFKLKKGGEEVAAYLASVGPAVEAAPAEEEAASD